MIVYCEANRARALIAGVCAGWRTLAICDAGFIVVRIDTYVRNMKESRMGGLENKNKVDKRSHESV